ncbi:MAG: 2-phospho-L-lactate transferase CofD family protein, partial [Candidatus Omnitrophota bacterium]|nr:2-phospho-L-lactate transferase CofD family protein [Candidatus Omnitrophota bacterium]
MTTDEALLKTGENGLPFIAATDLTGVVIYHPAYFHESDDKRSEINYHEYISHIAKGIADEDAAHADTREFIWFASPLMTVKALPGMAEVQTDVLTLRMKSSEAHSLELSLDVTSGISRKEIYTLGDQLRAYTARLTANEQQALIERTNGRLTIHMHGQQGPIATVAGGVVYISYRALRAPLETTVEPAYLSELYKVLPVIFAYILDYFINPDASPEESLRKRLGNGSQKELRDSLDYVVGVNVRNRLMTVAEPLVETLPATHEFLRAQGVSPSKATLKKLFGRRPGQWATAFNRNRLQMSKAQFLLEYGFDGYVHAGFFGAARREIQQKLNSWFGRDGWQEMHLVEGRLLTPQQAILTYEDSYYYYFRSHPEVLEGLVSTASDVYDTAPSNVHSKLDYSNQEAPDKGQHLHDIAVRRAVRRLGKQFRGSKLIQIRGRSSEGFHLNPGQLPFHRPEIIVNKVGGWWKYGTIEDFWQNSKVIVLREDIQSRIYRDRRPQDASELALTLFEKILPLFFNEELTVDNIDDLFWSLDAAEFLRAPDGQPKAFSDGEIYNVLNELLYLYEFVFEITGNRVKKQFLTQARSWYAQVTNPSTYEQYQAIAQNHIALIPMMFKVLEQKTAMPIFLIRDALAMYEFGGYRAKIRGEPFKAGTLYQPGVPTQYSGSSHRASHPVLDEILFATRRIMIDIKTAMKAEGLITPEMEEPGSQNKNPQVYQEFSRRFARGVVQAIERNPTFRRYSRRLYQRFNRNNVAGENAFLIVDTFGTGRTALYMKSVIEHFAAQEGKQISVDILLGRSIDRSLSLPDLNEHMELQEGDFGDLQWPFSFDRFNAPLNRPIFAVNKNITQHMLLVYRSFLLYNKAVETLRAAAREQQAGESDRTRPYSKLPVLAGKHAEAVAAYGEQTAAKVKVTVSGEHVRVTLEEGHLRGNWETVIVEQVRRLVQAQRAPPVFELPSTFTVVVTTETGEGKLVASPEGLPAGQAGTPYVAASQMSSRTVLFHPYYFEQSSAKQFEVLYHELVSHIVRAISDEDAAQADTEAFSERALSRGANFQELPFYTRAKVLAHVRMSRVYVKPAGWVDLHEEIRRRKILYIERAGGEPSAHGSIDAQGNIYVFVTSRDDIPAITYLVIQQVIMSILKIKGVPQAAERTRKFLDVNFRHIFRPRHQSFITAIVGGTGGRLLARLQQLFVKIVSVSGEVPITFVVSPYDDGGGSRRIRDEIVRMWGVWTPAGGDEMNIIAGLARSFYGYIIRRRTNGAGDEAAGTFEALMEAVIREAGESDPAFEREKIAQFSERFLPYVRSFDANFVRTGKISIYKQSLGNLIRAAVMLHEGAFSASGVDEDRYYRAMDILTALFDVDNVQIIPSSFEEGTLYGILESFEARTDSDPVGKPLAMGGETAVGEERIRLQRTGEGTYELRMAGAESVRVLIGEKLGEAIRPGESATVVRVMRGDETLEVVELDTRGAGKKITVDGKALVLKGRLVIEQTNVTDSLHYSKFERFGFINGKRPAASRAALRAIGNTKGILFTGPGSLHTSLLPVLMNQGVPEELSRKSREVPCCWVMNPMTDNETVGYSYEDVPAQVERLTGVPFAEMYSRAVVNDMARALGRMSPEERGRTQELMDELRLHAAELPELLGRDAGSFSKLAKFSRGQFAGNVAGFAEGMRGAGVSVLMEPLLSLTRREVRAGGKGQKTEESLGYPAERLTEVFETLIYESIRQGVAWQALKGDRNLSDSTILGRVYTIQQMWPELSMKEAVDYLYEIENSPVILEFGLPVLTREDLPKSVKMVVSNFAYTFAYPDAEYRFTVPESVIRSLEEFLMTRRQMKLVVVSGLSLREMKEAFLQRLRKDVLRQIYVITESGAEIYRFNHQGEAEPLISLAPVTMDIEQTVKAERIIDAVIADLGLGRGLTDSLGKKVAEPPKVRPRAKSFVIELAEWMIHPSSKYLDTARQYGDIRKAVIKQLNARFAQEDLPLQAVPAGLGAVNVIGKTDGSLKQKALVVLLKSEEMQRFMAEQQVKQEEILLLGRGLTGFYGVQQQVSRSVFIEPFAELFEPGVGLYYRLGTAGTVDLFKHLNENHNGNHDFVSHAYSQLPVPAGKHAETVAAYGEQTIARVRVTVNGEQVNAIVEQGQLHGDWETVIVEQVRKLVKAQRAPPAFELPSTFTVVVTTERGSGRLVASPAGAPYIAAANISAREVLVHPHYFEQSEIKQFEIFYHELVSHIAKGIENEDAAQADTARFVRLYRVFLNNAELLENAVNRAAQTTDKSREEILKGMFHPADREEVRAQLARNLDAVVEEGQERILSFGGGSGMLANLRNLNKIIKGRKLVVEAIQTSIDDGGSTFKMIVSLIAAGYGWAPSMGDIVNSLFKGFATADKLYKLLDDQGRIGVAGEKDLREGSLPAVDTEGKPFMKGKIVFYGEYYGKKDDQGVANNSDVVYVDDFRELVTRLLSRIVDVVNFGEGVGYGPKSKEMADDFAFFAVSLMNLVDIIMPYFERNLIPLSGASIRNLLLIGAMDYLGLIDIHQPKFAPNSREPLLQTQKEFQVFHQSIDLLARMAGIANGRSALAHLTPETVYAVYEDYIILVENPAQEKDNKFWVAVKVDPARKLAHVRVQDQMAAVQVSHLDRVRTIPLPGGMILRASVSPEGAFQFWLAARQNQTLTTSDEISIVEASVIEQSHVIHKSTDRRPNRYEMSTDGTGRLKHPMAQPGVVDYQPLQTLGLNVYIRSRLVTMQTDITETANYSKIVDYGVAEPAGTEMVWNAKEAAAEPQPVYRSSLQRRMKANPDIIRKIKSPKTRGITFGPGSPFTSTLVHLLVEGLPEALAERRRKGDIPILFIFNPTIDNESAGFTIEEFVDFIEKRTGFKFGDLFTGISVTKFDTVKLQEHFGVEKDHETAQWYVDRVMEDQDLIQELG